MVGDVVGQCGRSTLAATLPTIYTMYSPELVVVNGENATSGRGLTPHHAQQLFSVGANVITLGNHTWDQKDLVSHLDNEPRIIRPANFPPGTPGNGFTIVMAANGVKVGIANLMGRVQMDPLEDPFKHADLIIQHFANERVKVSLFDVHAEATSEKQAIGYYLDGRASVVVGTHTHVQTADEQVLPGGTAYITDVGMTGPQHSVIGMNVEQVLRRFTTQRPTRFDVADGPGMLNAILADINAQSGHAISIERICMRDVEY
jgi:2',3'-cyclic-nucleotide 2'-phosphodiesterase